MTVVKIVPAKILCCYFRQNLFTFAIAQLFHGPNTPLQRIKADTKPLLWSVVESPFFGAVCCPFVVSFGLFSVLGTACICRPLITPVPRFTGIFPYFFLFQGCGRGFLWQTVHGNSAYSTPLPVIQHSVIFCPSCTWSHGILPCGVPHYAVLLCSSGRFTTLLTLVCVLAVAAVKVCLSCGASSNHLPLTPLLSHSSPNPTPSSGARCVIVVTVLSHSSPVPPSFSHLQLSLLFLLPILPPYQAVSLGRFKCAGCHRGLQTP